MKKFFAGIILSLATVAALAMPRPSDIENAFAAGDYQSAKSMTQEVLRERPDSAKAHLFNAYALLKANNDRQGAAAELKTARMLDKNHSVQNSALFGRTTAELERTPNPIQRMAPSQRRYEPAPVTYTEVKPAGGSGIMAVLKFLFWATIIGLIVYFIYKVWQNSRQVVVVRDPVQSWAETPVQPLRTERLYTNQGRTYDAPPHPVYPSAPMTVQPAVVQPSTVVVHDNGMNNLMTGMMLNEAMHHHHHHDSYGIDSGHGRIIERETYVEAAPAYQPSYPSDTTDYETKRSSYSSGSDDWSSSSSSSSYSSSSSSSDDWGSSSSSSSYDSGSSWDSGSSSSSWD